jgi:hypothetical protein
VNWYTYITPSYDAADNSYGAMAAPLCDAGLQLRKEEESRGTVGPSADMLLQ